MSTCDRISSPLIFALVILPILPVLGGVLEVVQIDPTSNALTAPVNGSISVTFDRAIDPATIVASSFWGFGRWSGTVSGTYSFTNGNETVTLTPSTPFSAGEQVMVILSNAITAVDGSTFAPGAYSWLFWTAAQPATLDFTNIDTFTTRTTPSVSVRSYGGIGTDLDNDGHLDITVVNEDTADLRVFLNAADGSGLFDSMVLPISSVGLQASPNEPADFNHDGNADICVCNIANDTVSILLGDGDGTFGPQQLIVVGDGPRGIATLDVDGDGDIDIVNTNYNSGNLSLLLNDGNGVFGAPTFFDGGGSGERSLATADMNEDGRLDLIIGTYNGGQLIVRLSNGDGTFTQSDIETGITATWMLAVADLNGDGHVDVTSVNATLNNGSIHFGAGDGTITSSAFYPCDPFPLATDVGDLDGDGDLDWMTSSFAGDWFLFLNDGSGVFTFQEEFLAPIAASCAVMMDIDTDGDLDLALIDEIQDVVILQQNGNVIVEEFIRGDANLDLLLDVADAISSLDYLFGGVPGNPCPNALDSNDDGALDISDPVHFLSYLFAMGTPPPPPHPGCGPDPTAGALDCPSFVGCP